MGRGLKYDIPGEDWRLGIDDVVQRGVLCDDLVLVVVDVGDDTKLAVVGDGQASGVGQVGAGLVRPPMSIFEDALVAFGEQYF